MGSKVLEALLKIDSKYYRLIHLFLPSLNHFVKPLAQSLKLNLPFLVLFKATNFPKIYVLRFLYLYFSIGLTL